MGQTMIYKEEKIDDTKGIFRNRKSTENGTNNDLQERKDWRYQRDIQKPQVDGKWDKQWSTRKKRLTIPKGYSEAESRRKMGQTMIYKEEKIDDTKGIFRSRKSTENRTNNDLQNTTQKTKDWTKNMCKLFLRTVRFNYIYSMV